MTDDKKLQGVQRFLAMIPHCQLIGMQVEAIEADSIVFSLPANPQLTGNAEDQLIHGGALTVLMDTACGSAAILALPQPEICPTVDLRMDHYAAARADKPVYCRAAVTRLAQQIVFVEGHIWQDTEQQLIAKGTGTFMRLGAERTPQGFADYLFRDAKETRA